MTMAFPTRIGNSDPSAFIPIPICSDRMNSQPLQLEPSSSRACPRSATLRSWPCESGSRVQRRRTYPPQNNKRRLQPLRPALPSQSGVDRCFNTSKDSAGYFNCPTSMSYPFDLSSGHMSIEEVFENCCCPTFGEGSCAYCTARLCFDNSHLAYDNASSGSGSTSEEVNFQQPQSLNQFFPNNLFSEPAEYIPVRPMPSNLQDQFGFTNSLIVSPHDPSPMRNDSDTAYSSHSSSNEQAWAVKSTPSPQSSADSTKVPESPQYKCKHCGRSFTVERNKTRHEESSCPNLPDDQKKQYSCAECNSISKFSRSDGLTKHITDVHRKCTRCLDEHGISEVFSSINEIKEHKRDCHRVPIRNASGPQEYATTPGGSFQCETHLMEVAPLGQPSCMRVEDLSLRILGAHPNNVTSCYSLVAVLRDFSLARDPARTRRYVDRQSEEFE
ncbi:hypothetical protein DE146DRAFT_635651 [Phaeosphaeria sp. MPI-PUGE-AT-0046c]|nr:hypothetical protein DE146DRAFT_635651 [Phaeosphaeria sp. MPI-PUGE-AT-0046c]